LESRFGRDFSSVRVHTDQLAQASAQSHGALAYTVGSDIAFAPGAYAPRTPHGLHLLAHELVHTIQQRDATPSAADTGPGPPEAEREADRIAQAVVAAPHGARSATIPGSVGTIIRHAVLQRQTSAPTASATTAPATSAPLSSYAQALTALQAMDPSLHGYLSRATPGGGPVPVRTGQAHLEDTGGTLTYTFLLEVRSGTLPAPRLAQFTPANPNIVRSGPNASLTATMTLEFATPSGAGATGELARSLYHEGLHMLLFMDRFLPQAQQSPHTASLANYTRIATAHAEYGTLWAELEVYIDLDLQNRAARPRSPGLPSLPPLPPGYASRSAREILAHLVEEKYVTDLEAATPGATRPTNRSLAVSYLLEGFRSVGVSATPTNPDVVRMVNRIALIFDEIDRRTRPAPGPTPSGAGSSPSPSSVPPPKPAPSTPRTP